MKKVNEFDAYFLARAVVDGVMTLDEIPRKLKKLRKAVERHIEILLAGEEDPQVGN